MIGTEPQDFVICRICGKELGKITHLHVRSKYCKKFQEEAGIVISSMYQYQVLYPDAPLTSGIVRVKMSVSITLMMEDGEISRKSVETRQKRYPSGWKNPGQVWETRRKNDPNNEASKRGIETRRKNNPNNECYRKTVETREELYDWSAVMREKAWTTRRERYGHSGNKNPESARKAMSETWKKYFSELTPEEKLDFLNKTVFKGNLHPNMSESKLLSRIQSLGFKYNGRGPVVIGGRVPDFVHMDLPLIIEYDGQGGHNPSLPWIPSDIIERDNLRDQVYQDSGYGVLRILPKHLRMGEEYVQNMVKEWMN